MTTTAVSKSPSGSESLSNSVEEPLAVRLTVPASSTVRASLTVMGRSFTGLMVMVTVTVLPLMNPSLGA